MSFIKVTIIQVKQYNFILSLLIHIHRYLFITTYSVINKYFHMRVTLFASIADFLK